MSDDVLSIQARADFSALFRESQKAADAVTSSAAQITAAMNSAGNAPNKLTFSTMEARHALMGMGEEIGVKMPRFVGSWVASLEGVGPALATAFSAIAVIGLVEVLARVPEAIDKIVSKFSGWDEAAKGAYAAQVALNKQIIEYGRALALETISNDEAGLKGAQRTQKELTDIDLKISKIRQYRAEEIAVAAAAQKELDATIVTAAHLSGRVMIQRTEVRAVEEGSDAWKTKRKVIEDAGTAVARYDNEIAKLQQVETPRKKLTLGTEQQDAAEQAAKKAEAEQERAAKEAARAQHEEILGEINDLERAAKEKTKLLTEEAKENKEANKEMDHSAEEAAKATERAWEKAWEAIVKAQNKANKQTEEANKKLQEQWNHALAPVNRAFDQMVDGLLRGNMRISEIFRNLGISMLTPILTAFEKAIEAQIEYSITAGAIGKEHAMSDILRSAYQAAAKVYAEVPFPFNIPAAAGMFATVAALGGGMPSAAGGMWKVPDDMPIFAHAGESVLPAWAAGGLREMVAGGGGGGHTFHQTLNINGNADSDTVARGGRQIVKMAMKELRRMNR